MHSDSLMDNIKNLTLEFITTLLKWLPKTVEKDQPLLEEILQAYMKFMISVDDDIDEEWKTPSRGFSIENEEANQDAMAIGVKQIDFLIEGIGQEIMIPLLMQIVDTYIWEHDWWQKSAALLVLSQFSEYIMDMAMIDPTVEPVVDLLEHEHPKVRYAALHCLG